MVLLNSVTRQLRPCNLRTIEYSNFSINALTLEVPVESIGPRGQVSCAVTLRK